MPSTRSNRLPAGLLGMLAVVALLELSAFRSDRFTTDQALSWRFKGEWADSRAEGADVLVFGDSLMEFGILPGVLRERTGLRVVNLATHNGSNAVSFFLLRRAFAAGARPKFILVDFMPHQLAKNPADPTFARSWPELLTLRESIDVARSANDAGLFGAIWTAKLLPSVAARHEVRAAILAALDGGAYSAKAQAKLLKRNWEANAGAQVFPESFSRTVEFFDGLFPETWTTDTSAVAYAERFLALAESEGVPVFWVVPPVRAGGQAWRDARDLDRPYLDFARNLRSKHANITIIDGRGCGYGDPMFADAVHLNRAGAESFSTRLAEVMAAGSDAGFVALGPGVGRESVSGVEDMNESRMALRGDRSKSRRARE